MNYKYIYPPESCTGCALCANVCNKDAICMDWSDEGFLEPKVNTDACINCGLCVKKCPVQDGAMDADQYHDDINNVIAYGGWNNEADTHEKSSSGGIFSALAAKVFAVGGCVFGGGWKNNVTAVFGKAENMEQLAPMRGSKYTQAVPEYVYREVKKELKRGRQVLFTGTACQVYALKKYLRNPYDNLLTVDIVCHGVPSRKLLQSYVKYYERKQGKEIKEVYFRFKDGNWHNYKVQKRFADGTALNNENGQDLFMRLFIGDAMLNKACYNCPHAHFPRPADMTLGDYWGDLQSRHPSWTISLGVGSIIANNEKGRRVLEALADDKQISLHREMFIDLYRGQPRSYLRESAHAMPLFRSAALAALSKMSIDKVFILYHDSIILGPFIFPKIASLIEESA